MDPWKHHKHQHPFTIGSCNLLEICPPFWIENVWLDGLIPLAVLLYHFFTIHSPRWRLCPAYCFPLFAPVLDWRRCLSKGYLLVCCRLICIWVAFNCIFSMFFLSFCWPLHGRGNFWGCVKVCFTLHWWRMFSSHWLAWLGTIWWEVMIWVELDGSIS